MILVTVGTSQYPFDRLLKAVGELAGSEPLTVQHGPSKLRLEGAENVEFLAFDELADKLREARTVITHAGAGSVIAALANGKRPLVVPRLQQFGEAVDDHQLISARRFEEAGLAILVEDPSDLARAVRELPADAVIPRRNRGDLAGEIRADLDTTALRPGEVLPRLVKGRL